MEAGRGGVPRALACRIEHSVGTWSPSLGKDLDPVMGLGRASLVCALCLDEVCVRGTLLGYTGS